jgi:hypothetical protein
VFLRRSSRVFLSPLRCEILDASNGRSSGPLPHGYGDGAHFWDIHHSGRNGDDRGMIEPELPATQPTPTIDASDALEFLQRLKADTRRVDGALRMLHEN